MLLATTPLQPLHFSKTFSELSATINNNGVNEFCIDDDNGENNSHSDMAIVTKSHHFHDDDSED